ncbi:MAG: type II toxin-antitoxin system VapC family toxin [Mycobacteriales bacterium]
MTYLLDTHVWLWMVAAPERLRKEVRILLASPASELVLSAASGWEISIKHALGRLSLPESPTTYVPSRLRATAVLPLAIEHRHALAAGQLPPHHRDPFDRLLVAQAQLEGLVLVTADPQLEPYEVRLLMA